MDANSYIDNLIVVYEANRAAERLESQRKINEAAKERDGLIEQWKNQLISYSNLPYFVIEAMQIDDVNEIALAGRILIDNCLPIAFHLYPHGYKRINKDVCESFGQKYVVHVPDGIDSYEGHCFVDCKEERFADIDNALLSARIHKPYYDELLLKAKAENEESERKKNDRQVKERTPKSSLEIAREAFENQDYSKSIAASLIELAEMLNHFDKTGIQTYINQ